MKFACGVSVIRFRVSSSAAHSDHSRTRLWLTTPSSQPSLPTRNRHMCSSPAMFDVLTLRRAVLQSGHVRNASPSPSLLFLHARSPSPVGIGLSMSLLPRTLFHCTYRPISSYSKSFYTQATSEISLPLGSDMEFPAPPSPSPLFGTPNHAPGRLPPLSHQAATAAQRKDSPTKPLGTPRRHPTSPSLNCTATSPPSRFPFTRRRRRSPSLFPQG